MRRPATRLRRRHRGAALSAAEQRHLADEVPGTEFGDLLALVEDQRRAFGEDVTRVGRDALLHQRPARRQGERAAGLDERLDVVACCSRRTSRSRCSVEISSRASRPCPPSSPATPDGRCQRSLGHRAAHARRTR